MKVLLISPNREHLPDPVYPLGLAYVAAAVRDSGHEVQALDLCFEEDSAAAIRGSLQDFRPDIIGISLRNIDDVSYPRRHSYLQDYRDTVDEVRRHSDALIVLGGSGFTIMPEAFMQELGADFGIIGEGEQACPELVRKIESGNMPFNFSRLIRAEARVRDLDLCSPDPVKFNAPDYYRLGGMLNVQTKRGCSFHCSYCTYPMIEGRDIRLREPSNVVNQIREIAGQTGAKHFFFVDSIFNHPASHAEAVCDELIRKRTGIKWTCYATPTGMTERLADKMARAGCTGVEFGIDSLSDDVLLNLDKGFDARAVRAASEACRKAGLKFCHFIFAGAPGDTDDKVARAIADLDDLNPDAAVIMTGIRVFPNTRLAERAEEELGIRDAGLEPVFYLSPAVSSYSRVRDEVSRRKNWIMPGHDVNMHPRLQRKLREHGIKGPLWEELSKRR
jgi:radical SAM superfamily enzyme YgiQ (UPF0313 family)